MLTSVLYAATLLTAILLAWLHGTRPERWVATVLLAGNVATIATILLGRDTDFSYVSGAYLGVDLLGAIALCMIAVRHPSWLTILVATFQINGTLGHAVKLVAPETMDLSYAILLRLWSWPMVLTSLVSRFRPDMRRILRQSDLFGMPGYLRPPLTPAGTIVRDQARFERPQEDEDQEISNEEGMERASTDPLRRQIDSHTAGRRTNEVREMDAGRRTVDRALPWRDGLKGTTQSW